MRILIATGIYPPEIGGPAYYAKNLAEALRKRGHTVDIGTFGALKMLPIGLRHAALFLRFLPQVAKADHVIALDTFSAALPAYFAAKLFRKKLIVRTGGDFLWEQYVERTGDLLPLPFFYEKHKPFSRREHLYHFVTKFIVCHSVVIFSSRFQKDIWVSHYKADPNSPIIENAISERLESVAPERKNFVMYGRDIKLRNKKKLAVAYQNAKKIVPEITLETGQLPQGELMEKIRRAYVVILPSVSEITPNLILDALRCGKPFILSKYSEYATLYKEFGLFVDPLDANDISEKILMMCDDSTYAGFVERIKQNPLMRTYDDLADDFIRIVQKP
jgi:glycosyltransferase involved in cell wall biosynthesis